MKKIITLSLLTATLALSGTLQAQPIERRAIKNGDIRKAATLSTKPGKDFKSSRRPMKAAPQLTEVITEVEGREQYYLKASDGYFPFADYVYAYDQTDTPAFISFGLNNEVYFFDLMEFGYDTYIKGTIEGNKIRVPLPQTEFMEEFLWWDDGPSYYYYNLCVVKEDDSSETLNYEYEESITEVTYTIAEDGTISLDDLGEGYGLGLVTYIEDWADEEQTEKVWYHAWTGSTDFHQVFTPSDIEVVKIPKGADTETYFCIINGYNYPVTVAFIDDYMYIQGIYDSTYLSNITVKVTLDGEKGFLPSNQHIGVYRFDNVMLVTRCGRLNGYNLVYEDESANFGFTVDKDRKRITAADPKQILCLVTETDLGLLADMSDFSIIYQEKFEGVPMNPYNLFWNDRFYKDYDYYSFGFEISPFTADGDVLLTGDLYYRIFLDDELVEFVHEFDTDTMRYGHYYMVDEPTTEIPFFFNNDADLDLWTETERQVGIYIEGVSTMGVQAVYHFNGVTTVSDCVTLDIETGKVTTAPNNTGVDATLSDIFEAKAEWYDLNGRKISNPGKGIFVEKSLMSDGTIRVRKVAR